MRRILYIDGSNLYGGMSELLRAGEYFDGAELIGLLRSWIEVESIIFYATYLGYPVRANSPRDKRARAQFLFYNQIRQAAGVRFVKGYLSGAGKEKGIDVKLAVDIVKGALLDEYDEAWIMSGDDDFIYAVDTVRAAGKSVGVLAFANRYPFGLSHHVNTILVADFRRHFLEKLQTSIKPPGRPLEVREFDGLVRVMRV